MAKGNSSLALGYNPGIKKIKPGLSIYPKGTGGTALALQIRKFGK